MEQSAVVLFSSPPALFSKLAKQARMEKPMQHDLPPPWPFPSSSRATNAQRARAAQNLRSCLRELDDLRLHLAAAHCAMALAVVEEAEARVP